MTTPRANAEIDDLYFRITPLLLQAARSLCSHRADELHSEIWLLWYLRYRRNPLYWWGRFNASPGFVVTAAKDLGREVVRHWDQAERKAQSLDAVENPDHCLPIEWGLSNDELRYCDGIGDYLPGTHIATDEEVQVLFAHVARHNMTNEKGEGLGRIEALDLMQAFRKAKPSVAHAIRLIASGFGAKAVSNSHAYKQIATVLQAVL